MQLLNSLSALALLAGSACSIGGIDATDGSPPQVAITSPANGATVGGNVSIDAIAVDDFGVDIVRFFIDDVLLTQIFTAPYHAVWNTGAVPNNTPHVIKVEALDVAKNSKSIAITVTVSRGQQ